MIRKAAPPALLLIRALAVHAQSARIRTMCCTFGDLAFAFRVTTDFGEPYRGPTR